MSIDYLCDLATNAGVDGVATRLQALVGGAVTTDGGRILVSGGALIALVRPITDPVDKEWSLADWGLDPSVRISFSLDTSTADDEYAAGRRTLSVAAVRLAVDLDVDAILRFEMDRLMMRRQDGALTLYDWWPEWSDAEVITSLPPGYTVTSDGKDASPSRPFSGPELGR